MDWTKDLERWESLLSPKYQFYGATTYITTCKPQCLRAVKCPRAVAYDDLFLFWYPQAETIKKNQIFDSNFGKLLLRLIKISAKYFADLVLSFQNLLSDPKFIKIRWSYVDLKKIKNNIFRNNIFRDENFATFFIGNP